MRKFLLMIMAAIMFFITACNRGEGGDNGNSATSTGEKNSAISDISSDMFAETDNESEQSTDKEEDALNIEITIGGRVFSATFYDNETARALKKRMPLTLDMSELNGNEKYYYLPDDLPTSSSRPSEIHTGDIMLYGDSCLVIFYKDFPTSYSYTPIGKIDATEGLAEALGIGSVQVGFK